MCLAARERRGPDIAAGDKCNLGAIGRYRRLGEVGDGLLRETLNIPVTVAEDPLTAIARGTGVILEDLDKYRSVLLESEDDIYSNK